MLAAPARRSPKLQRYSSAGLRAAAENLEWTRRHRDARARTGVEEGDRVGHPGRAAAIESAGAANVIASRQPRAPGAERRQQRVHVAGWVHQRAAPGLVAEAEHVAELVHGGQPAQCAAAATARHSHVHGHERRGIAGARAARDALAAVAAHAAAAGITEDHARAVCRRAREAHADAGPVPGLDRQPHRGVVERRPAPDRDRLVRPALAGDAVGARRLGDARDGDDRREDDRGDAHQPGPRPQPRPRRRGGVIHAAVPVRREVPARAGPSRSCPRVPAPACPSPAPWRSRPPAG